MGWAEAGAPRVSHSPPPAKGWPAARAAATCESGQARGLSQHRAGGSEACPVVCWACHAASATLGAGRIACKLTSAAPTGLLQRQTCQQRESHARPAMQACKAGCASASDPKLEAGVLCQLRQQHSIRQQHSRTSTPGQSVGKLPMARCLPCPLLPVGRPARLHHFWRQPARVHGGGCGAAPR